MFCEVIASVILSKKVDMYMCPILNSFRDRATSLHSSKIVDKKVTKLVQNSQNFSGLFPSSCILKNTTFRKLDLFPSSGEGGEKTPTQLSPLERANLNHWTNPGPWKTPYKHLTTNIVI
jgi:hypothetical protein